MHLLKTATYWLRTALFYLFLVLWTFIWTNLIILFVRFIPERKRHTVCVKYWAVVTLTMCRVIAGIRWKVNGGHNIPDTPCVIASNHNSAWETFFLQILFTPQSTVLKHELLSIPFFGWALKRLNPIAINRKDKRSAMQQVMEKGKSRLHDNYWIVIFPEGTRYNWPEVGPYKRGAASLAIKADVPVVPVAHNAGQFWPNNSFLLRPGTIDVQIGAPVCCKNKTPQEVSAQLRSWAIDHMPERKRSVVSGDPELVSQ